MRCFTIYQVCIFGRDFLAPHTAIVSGIENYPTPACLVAVLRPLKSAVREYISPRINLLLACPNKK